jgi:hypothetical protein
MNVSISSDKMLQKKSKNMQMIYAPMLKSIVNIYIFSHEINATTQ